MRRFALSRFWPLLAFVLVGAATLKAETSVWKVTAGKNVLYLGGTCHILRAQDFPLPNEFDAAFAAASVVYFETDLARMSQPATQQALFGRGRFTDGNSLDKVLDAKAWQAVQDYCAKSGVPVEQIRQLRPWLFCLMIAVMELQKAGVTQEGVDLHFFKQVGPAGKTARGLEDFDEHIEFLVTMGAGHESEMVINTIEDLAKIPTQITGLIESWKTGDLPKIDALMLRDMREKYPAIYDQLLVKRNSNWLPRIEELLTTPETELVLVGFGHLASETGLVRELQKRGYGIERFTARN